MSCLRFLAITLMVQQQCRFYITLWLYVSCITCMCLVCVLNVSLMYLERVLNKLLVYVLKLYYISDKLFPLKKICALWKALIRFEVSKRLFAQKLQKSTKRLVRTKKTTQKQKNKSFKLLTSGKSIAGFSF